MTYFEISDPVTGDVIQRVSVLTRSEIERVTANGYRVRRVTLDRAVYRWLLDGDHA